MRQSQMKPSLSKNLRGIRSGPAFFQMEQLRLKRRKKQGECISEMEQHLLNVKWKHLNSQERLPFQKLHQEDRYEGQVGLTTHVI